MLRISYADSFLPDSTPTSAGLRWTASNGGGGTPSSGSSSEGGSGVFLPARQEQPTLLPLREKSRHIPVLGEVDVLVCGGGPAGIAAAVSSSRAGAHTLLLERYGFLGGLATGGYVIPHFDGFLNDGLNLELIEKLKARRAWGAPFWKISYDPEQFKQIAEEMALASGCDLLYHSLVVAAVMDGDRLRGVVVESKSGRFVIFAKVVVDCTGDGDVAARAGAPLVRGRESDGLMQAMTLMFRMGGVRWVQRDPDSLRLMVENAVAQSGDAFRLAFDHPWAIHLPSPDEVMLQLVHVRGVDGTDVRQLTRAEIDGRRQVRAVVDFLTTHTEEFKKAHLIETAPIFGVRETRHILGDYVLTIDDLKSGRTFEDGIASVSFNIDIHHGEHKGQTGILLKRPYQIPYRSLVPQGVENLLVAGRCISGTYEAHASYRVKGPCIAMGQAAGAAAALSARAEVAPRKLDMAALWQELSRQGVHLKDEMPPDDLSNEG